MESFDAIANHKPGIIGIERYRRSAVIIPMVEKEGELFVLLEVRSSMLRVQPGEICLPGGGIEEGESPREAAVREALEELLISPEQISVLAELDLFLSPANVMIYPFLAFLKDYEMTYHTQEVEEVFLVPLSFFLTHSPETYLAAVKTHPQEDFPYELLSKGEDYEFLEGKYQILFYRYRQRVIWGMTAAILQSMADILQKYKIPPTVPKNI